MKDRVGGWAAVAIVAVAGALAVAYFLRREVAVSVASSPVREGPPSTEPQAEPTPEPAPGPVADPEGTEP